jgi:hypothetical protein
MSRDPVHLIECFCSVMFAKKVCEYIDSYSRSSSYKKDPNYHCPALYLDSEYCIDGTFMEKNFISRKNLRDQGGALEKFVVQSTQCMEKVQAIKSLYILALLLL